MATVAPPSDRILTTYPHLEAADLLQKLSLDSQSEALEAPAIPAKKYGLVDSSDPANGMAKPWNTNACYVPNSYYYGGYDRLGSESNDYANRDGGMAHVNSSYGDNSFMYHQGYGFPPYVPYPSPGSPAPTMGHDGQLYGQQHYQYPNTYYQAPTQTTRPYAPNQVSIPQGEFSTSVSANQVPPSVGVAKGNSNNMANGGRVNENSGSKSLIPSFQNSSLNSFGPYGRGGLPPFTNQDPRFGFDGIQSPIPSLDALPFSDRQSKHGASANNLSWRNQNLCPLPHFMNLHNARPTSGFGLASGFMNTTYPNNRMYGQYGNTFRAGSGSFGYDSRMNGRGLGIDPKYKRRGCGNGAFGYGNENLDSLNELNKGPRGKGCGPITLAVKGQNLSLTENNKEDKEQYNKEDFPEDYSDAKFFVIKSYSEDDVHKSMKYSVWASTPNGNKKLDAAYQEAKEKPGGCPVFLLFSVNGSGQFVGIAEMVGPLDFEKTVEYWQQDKWNGCFPVKWHIIKDIPNSLLKHITLENNENKPVTNSRDTQEVKFDQGIQILKIFKGHSSKTCVLDDFEFYEARQKIMQEKKTKQQHFQKQVGKPTDAVKDAGIEKLAKSLDTTLIKESVVAEAAELDNAVEEKGSAADAAGGAKPLVVSERKVIANGVASSH